MARQKQTGFSPARRRQRHRRIATKPHRLDSGSQCFCDACEGVMAEGVVYGLEDGFDDWLGSVRQRTTGGKT